MKTSIIYVTPAIATQYLESNAEFQRGVRSKEVKMLSEAMTRGEWILTHQGIAFDTNGKLIDGQHRLMAIIEANIPQDCLVVTGVDPAAFKVLDIGAKRSTSDMLAIDKKEAGVIGALARLDERVKSRPSPAQVSELYQQFKDQIKPVVVAATGKRTLFHTSSFQASAVMTIASEPRQQEYVLDLYRKMCSLDIERLPQVANSAVRAALTGTLRAAGGTDRQVLFACGMKVFNEDYKDSKSIPTRLIDADGFYISAKQALQTIVTA